MANSTLVSHALTLTGNQCGGPVVLDGSNVVKLIGPSFAISSGGIEGVTLDTHVIAGVHIPEFECLACGEHIGAERVPHALGIVCHICGETVLIENAYVHKYIPCICATCKDKVTECALDDGRHPETLIRSYVSTYALVDEVNGSRSKKLSLVPMQKVFSSPIKI